MTAEHVSPTPIDFSAGPPPQCSDFNASWIEMKVDPAVDGSHTDGTLNVTLVVWDDEDDEPVEFDWMSNIGVAAVVVVDGSHGHHMYSYSPDEMDDTGLTAGEHNRHEDKFGAISQILFCYMGEDDMPNGDHCAAGTLSAIANGDGSITVFVSDLEADATLMRSHGGDFEHVANFNATNDTYLDTDTEVGVTYTYQLVIDGEVCDEIEVTAIPVFPGLIAAGLATVLGVLGYLGFRRRN